MRIEELVMKKTGVVLLTAMISLALFGCSNDATPTEKETETVIETQTQIQTEQTTITESETEAVPATAAPVLDSSAVNVVMIDGKVRFEISPSFELSDSAWLGMVAAGSEFTTESEARADRSFWVRVEDFDGRKPTEPYVFVYSGEDIAMFPQEEFTMVLCDRDNGKVVLQFPVTVSGVELKCDLEQIKFN